MIPGLCLRLRESLDGTSIFRLLSVTDTWRTCCAKKLQKRLMVVRPKVLVKEFPLGCVPAGGRG